MFGVGPPALPDDGFDAFTGLSGKAPVLRLGGTILQRRE